MDFTKFDTSAQADAGRAFPILHHVTRKPMEQDGKTAMFIIRAAAAPTPAAATKLKRSEAETLADLASGNYSAVAAYIAGFVNVERDGRPATAADAEWFLSITPEMFKRKADGTYATDPKTGGLIQTNYTFAQQVMARAAEFREELGNV